MTLTSSPCRQVRDFFASLSKAQPLILTAVRALQKQADMRHDPKAGDNDPVPTAVAGSAVAEGVAAGGIQSEATAKERLHLCARVCELTMLSCLVFRTAVLPSDLETLGIARQIQECASGPRPSGLIAEAKALSASLLQNTSVLLPSLVLQLAPVGSENSAGTSTSADVRSFLVGRLLPTVLSWLHKHNIESANTVSLLETLACIWRRDAMTGIDPKVGRPAMESTVAAVSFVRQM